MFCSDLLQTLQVITWLMLLEMGVRKAHQAVVLDKRSPSIRTLFSTIKVKLAVLHTCQLCPACASKYLAIFRTTVLLGPVQRCNITAIGTCAGVYLLFQRCVCLCRSCVCYLQL